MSSLLKTIYDNAVKNSEVFSKQAYRHNDAVKKVASALYCMIGKGGYELLQTNLGSALPSINTVQRQVSQRKITEGQFHFNELKTHLIEWNAPLRVNIHIDDTRIKNDVKYDAASDRFVRYCLPQKDAIPEVDYFRLQSFEEIKSAFVNNSLAKCAYRIVAKSVNTTVPSFILCLLGTDSKYKHSDITLRWKHIATSLGKLGITVLSNGADGAGPFLKAMITESKLFSRSEHLPVKWTFFLMPIINAQNLNAQDHVHLLAKLRSRLLKPSNLLVLGTENACRTHIQHVFDRFPKEKHNLTQRAIDSRDKQNYTSIRSLISKDVEHCLMDLNPKIRNLGTIVYLSLMRNIRDSVFNKSISSLKRIELMWTAAFFCRIWRKWI